MLFKSISILCLFALTSSTEIEVDTKEPLSYFRAAEDIAASANMTNKNIQDIKHLYVLAAVLDPSLRENALLGLIEIESDPTFRGMLKAMLADSETLLVPEVILHKDSPMLLNPQTSENLCKSLVKIRVGKNITSLQLKELRPWRYLFPAIYDRVLQNPGTRKKLTSPTEIMLTIKVELALLGGPSLWSADFVTTNGKPVSFSLNDDLASLFRIDPTKVVRKNGRWTSE